MEDYTDIRVLLTIELFDRTYYYSDRDGPAHSFSTSTDGRVVVEDDIQLYEGVITNAAGIKESFNVEDGTPSIGNVGITVFNKDNLHENNEPVALESGTATVALVRGDMYDQVVDSIVGRIDEVSYDNVSLSFTVKSDEIAIFKTVPEILLEEDTFQTRLVLFEPEFDISDEIVLRFAKAGNTEIATRVIKKIYHSSLIAPREIGDGLPYVDDYWVGARVDVIDAPGAFGDPELETFAIGEFAIVADSDENWVQLPTVVDRYAQYLFIDDNLRKIPAVDPDIDIPYEVRDIINNTTQNTARMAQLALLNASFSTNGTFTAVANLGGTPNEVRVTTAAAHGMEAGDFLSIYASTSYDGQYTITNVNSSTTFDIESPFAGTDTGSWVYAWKITNPPWSIVANNLTRAAGAAFTIVAAQANLGLVENTVYTVTVTVSAITVPAGKALVVYLSHSTGRITSTGTHTFELTAIGTDTVDAIGFYTDDINVTATIDSVAIEEFGRPTLQIIRKGIPENADSVGRAFPIVYGAVEKLWAVWSISSKSTRQNSISSGDDVYVIAGHRILDKEPTEIKVYYGLDEKAAEWMTVKPGHIDYVPNPLPRSINEIERWHESGYNLASGDPDKDVSPLHSLLEITTNKGDLVTAVKLRGDEFDGWIPDPAGEDGDIALVDGKPQFPIRYGLGNSKVYVSFRGHPDENGTITGVKGGLIEHPIDIIRHFLLTYTNINGDISKIDEDSFALAKAKLPNWKFGVAITDTADGSEIIERLIKQCKASYSWKNNKFKINVLDLEDANAVRYIDQEKHFVGRQSWRRTPLSAIFNDFTVRYGYNAANEKFDRVVKRSKKNDQRCRDSFARYGVVRSYQDVELPDVYDSYTANAFTDHLVALHALSRTLFSTGLRLADETYGMVVGEVVSISFRDSTGAISESLYLTTSVSSSSTGYTAEFLELN